MNSSRLILMENEVHIWRAPLITSIDTQNEFFATFNLPEKIRAERFHFPLHKHRFIAARGILRQLISRYQNITPGKVNFLYQARGKPYLADDTLQFNVSHSHDVAVFVFTKHFAIGADIEKMESKSHDSTAKLYFHPEEYSQLLELPPTQQSAEFYRIWTRKEALIKAIGEGLYFTLNSFSTMPHGPISVKHADVETLWYLQDFPAHSDYQAALATQYASPKISYFEWCETASNVARMQRSGIRGN